MRNSKAEEFISPAELEISFRTLSLRDVGRLLLPFYLALDFDARRSRFGAAVSDEVIVSHCTRLDLDQAVVLACLGPSGLLAVIEIHPTSLRWQAAELVIAHSAPTNRIMILGHLLQLAAFAAGRRGCSTIIAPIEIHDHELLELLRSMGRVDVKGDMACVDLGEYARMHGLAIVERS